MSSEKIIPALYKARSEMGAVKKSAVNPFHKSKYANLKAVQEVIEKPLADNQLMFVHTVEDGSIVTTLWHLPSMQSISSKMPLTMAKQDPQGLGSAITYFRRYSMVAILDLEQEDDDGNFATMPAEKPENNGQKPNAASTQKAGAQRGRQIREYFEANFIKEKEVRDMLTKYKVTKADDLPVNVADQLIKLGLDRETLANDEKVK